ncbi:hypothetical protein CEUSTIGMA_g5009.t1 [Chlamydomonas eustigma]|uniref:SnoaL-like domain-containing protein n=1 Tax=Chlamydomonas eustigma TaxID=1157962 RepID=A0A250X3C4_9CHLO|nr:hypothetical protein CEUSTIGMA_g5009.t1 [Chlamydomonas eustigma]|eukprot:GAX77565.1 hypothetical protein CEUSTIGMA_g5009.t1 [Chlamydomonas eustigma]
MRSCLRTCHFLQSRQVVQQARLTLVPRRDNNKSRRFKSAVTRMDSNSDVVLSVVNKQVEFYNARDLESFMDLMAEDVHVSDSETGAVLATNKHELRPRYVERFKTPVHAEILGRLCCGDTVVDRELITGLPGDGQADCMATYVVKEGKISKIQFVWRSRTPGVKL